MWVARFQAHLPRAHLLRRGDHEKPDRPAADHGRAPVGANATEASGMPRHGRRLDEACVGDVEPGREGNK